MGRAPGLGTLVQMASEQKDTLSFGKSKQGMVGFGQGVRIGNFGEDSVRAGGNSFSFGKPHEKGRFWAGCLDWELW